MMRAGMTPPNKGQRYPAVVLEPAEVQARLDQLSRKSATGIRNRALVVLLYKSGLRVSEICNLTPADVNLDKHSVRVRLGKGQKTTTRGFHPSATGALAQWTDTRKAMGFRNGPLFCTRQGGPSAISTSATCCTSSPPRPGSASVFKATGRAGLTADDRAGLGVLAARFPLLG